MATLEQLERAFIQADDAGNVEDAQAFANEIKRLRANTQVSTEQNKSVVAPAIEPTIQEKLAKAKQQRADVENMEVEPESTFLRRTVQGAASGPVSGAMQMVAEKTGNQKLANKIAKGASQGNLLGAVLQPEGLLTGGAMGKFIGQGANALTKGIRGAALGAGYGGTSAVATGGDRGEQASYGALFGGLAGPVIQGATNLALKGKEIIDPFIGQAGRQRAAARLASEASKNSGLREQIADLLMQAKAGQTAKDAILPAMNPEVTALQEIVGATKPQLKILDDIARDNSAQNLVNKIARSDDVLEKAVKRRTAITEPMRKTAMQAAGQADKTLAKYQPIVNQKLDEATSNVQRVREMNNLENVAGDLASKGQARLGYDPKKAMGGTEQMPKIGSNYTYPKVLQNIASKEGVESAEKSLIAGEQARFGQSIIDSLEAYKLKPLNVDSITQSINNKIRQPGEGIGLDRKVLTGITDELQTIKNLKGQVYPEDLHEIRKKGINDVIESLNTGNTGSTQKRASSVAKDVANKIDEVLDNASGGMWKPYLNEYQRKSKLINEIEVGKELKTALSGAFGKERATVLGNKINKLSEDINPKTGKPYIDALGIKSKNVVKALEQQFKDEETLKALTKAGTPEAFKLLRATETQLPSAPGMLSAKVTVYNKIVNLLSGKGGEKTNKELAELMYKNPKLLGETMQKISPENRSKVIKALTEQRALPYGFGAMANMQQGEQ